MAMIKPCTCYQRLWLLVSILVHSWYLGSCDLEKSGEDVMKDADFYSYSVLDITGNAVSLEQYRGKISLVVNVASQCGYTNSHYHALNSLQDYFGSTGKFNVLAFPCDQFGHQEPGTNKEILDFARNRMHANFPLFSKINVKEPDASPAWNYLTKNSGYTPSWNFWKYLVDHNGRVLNAWGPSTNPDQLYPEIKAAIDKIDSDHRSTTHDDKRQGSREEF